MNAKEFAADIYIGHNAVGRVAGNWREKSFQISMNGIRIAWVPKETAGLILDADSYCVHIAAHVDYAFITMVVIALDEIYPKW